MSTRFIKRSQKKILRTKMWPRHDEPLTGHGPCVTGSPNVYRATKDYRSEVKPLTIFSCWLFISVAGLLITEQTSMQRVYTTRWGVTAYHRQKNYSTGTHSRAFSVTPNREKKKSFIYLVIKIELDNVPVVRQTEGLVVSTVRQMRLKGNGWIITDEKYPRRQARSAELCRLLGRQGT